MTELVRYEAARVALAECARVDEAAKIRDKAAALRLYAKQRDDKDMTVWVSEIHLRACIRIGELSRELERSPGGRPPKNPSSRVEGFPTKAEALEEAGVPVSTAAHYEQLAGGRQEQGQAAGKAAAEAYFAQARAAGEPATMTGLRGAVRGALDATLGPRAPRRPLPPRAAQEDTSPTQGEAA